MGVELHGSATLGGVEYAASAVTDAAGNYSMQVFAGAWNVGVSGDALRAQGFLSPPDQGAVVTTGNVIRDFIAPHATATIHGTVMTPSSVPLPFVEVTAREVGGTGLQTVGMTDANGEYTLGVIVGTWDVGAVATSYVGERQNVVVNTNGSDVLRDLVVHPVTAHLRGQVRDDHNNPVANLKIVARDPNAVNTSVSGATDAAGGFDLAVYGGEAVGATRQWTLQVLVDS